jgi:hypothetical protein
MSTAWTCSASAAYVNLGGTQGVTLDPLHANIDPSAPCTQDGSSVPALAFNNALGPNTVSGSSATAFAQTALQAAGAPTARQAPGAQAGLQDLDVNLGSGQLHIALHTAVGVVAGGCTAGLPSFRSAGQVVGLSINGTPVPGSGQPDATLDQVFTGLSPLAPVVRVLLNHDYPGGTTSTADQSLTREAVRIEALSANGTPVATAVIGRATADRHGPVCDATTGAANPGTASTGSRAGASGPGGASGGASSGSSDGSSAGGSASNYSSTVFGSRANGVNASNCARLRLWFDQRPHGRAAMARGPRALVTQRGIRRVLRGRVVNCQGKPILRAKIDQIHLFAGKRRLKTGLRSRGRGRLTLILPNNLTTRRLVFTYRGSLDRPDVASRTVLRLTVLGGRRRGHRRH